MKTANIDFIRGVYHLSKILENDDKYYKLENKELLNDEVLQTETVKLEKRNYFNSKTLDFEYYLRLRTDTNWQRCAKTGLAFTNTTNVFQGNISAVMDLGQRRENGKPFENPKHFVIAQLINDSKTLVLDIFKDFYPVNRDARKCFINEHNLYK